MSRRRIEGIAALSAALDAGARLALVLCAEGERSPSARALLERVRALGIPVHEESEREMRRMSTGRERPELIALEGPAPAPTLEGVMQSGGLVLLLVGLRYPGNVGFILRATEVAGAEGVVLALDWEREQRVEALRVGMRAHRFFPVVDATAEAAMAAARRAGRRVIALETSGEQAPWAVSLRGPIVLVVGGETNGIPTDLLAEADARVRVPMGGFIPSYNVQAAVGVLLGEWLRQTAGS